MNNLIITKMKKVTTEEASIIAVEISEKIKPELNANEQSFFVAGFAECVKYFNVFTQESNKYSLTNRDIYINYSDKTFHLTLNDFKGAMAYWLASQQINANIDITKPVEAFTKYMQQKYFKTNGSVREFTYSHLENLISADVFIAIPELMELNEINGNDFYDLGALARNVFYMICREQITQPL